MQQDRASELFAEAMPPARREVLLQSLAASRRLCTATPQPPVPFAACLHRLPRVSRGLNVVYCYRYQRVQEEKRKKKIGSPHVKRSWQHAIPGFRKCHWPRISQYIKDCFQTFRQLSVSHFSSHSSRQINTSLPHLTSESDVSVSHTSWSTALLWTHSKPISSHPAASWPRSSTFLLSFSHNFLASIAHTPTAPQPDRNFAKPA